MEAQLQEARATAQQATQVAQAAASGAAIGNAAGQAAVQTTSMVDTRFLGTPERWNGGDAGWKEWRFITRAYLQAAMPIIGDLLDKAESDVEEVECLH